jgi:hypothetical protein
VLDRGRAPLAGGGVMPDFKTGDRVRTGKRMTNCEAYPHAVYVILAGPFENAYDDGSAKWSEYVGAFAEDGFRNIAKATLHTIDASEVYHVCAHDQIEAHDTGFYEPGKPAHHGFQSIWCEGPQPSVPIVAIDKIEALRRPLPPTQDIASIQYLTAWNAAIERVLVLAEVQR